MRESRRLGRLLAIGAVPVLAVGAFAASLYGCLYKAPGPPVVIDFTESIDSRVVYPMKSDIEVVGDPRRVELRFPDGRSYTTDHAQELWVDRSEADGTYLMESVSITTRPYALDEVYQRANRFRTYWGFPADPEFERWYEERKRSGPGEWSIDMAGRGHPVVGVERNGKRLTASFNIRGSRDFDPPYQLVEEFSWSDPRPDDVDR